MKKNNTQFFPALLALMIMLSAVFITVNIFSYFIDSKANQMSDKYGHKEFIISENDGIFNYKKHWTLFYFIESEKINPTTITKRYSNVDSFIVKWYKDNIDNTVFYMYWLWTTKEKSKYLDINSILKNKEDLSSIVIDEYYIIYDVSAEKKKPLGYVTEEWTVKSFNTDNIENVVKIIKESIDNEKKQSDRLINLNK